MDNICILSGRNGRVDSTGFINRFTNIRLSVRYRPRARHARRAWPTEPIRSQCRPRDPARPQALMWKVWRTPGFEEAGTAIQTKAPGRGTLIWPRLVSHEDSRRSSRGSAGHHHFWRTTISTAPAGLARSWNNSTRDHFGTGSPLGRKPQRRRRRAVDLAHMAPRGAPGRSSVQVAKIVRATIARLRAEMDIARAACNGATSLAHYLASPARRHPRKFSQAEVRCRGYFPHRGDRENQPLPATSQRLARKGR